MTWMSFFPKNASSTMAEIVLPFFFLFYTSLGTVSDVVRHQGNRQDNASPELQLFEDFMNAQRSEDQGYPIPTGPCSQFRVKNNLRKRNLLAGRPHFPIAHQATQEYRRSGVLKTSLQADPRHTKGEKKATVLMVSMMPPGTGGRRSLLVSGIPVCAFGLWALSGIPLVSNRECITCSLRKATPKGEAEQTPQKKQYAVIQYYWNISFVCLSFESN
ncbi:uncharacterized protein LOC116570709 isoform X5 [Mustela erminea]|uniref:uncharacterized protein LOC116570709 isoform X5 n=1 Tax=Mustela erminea TaxID=36723 RepID=UPI00138667E8|nr:uncharacterized protein LOC116570709 isoform X5 [Mustela erminea]